MGDWAGRRLESEAGVGDEHDKSCSQGPAAMCGGLCSCRGSEEGGDRVGQRGRRRAGYWLFPTAQLQCVVIDALVVTALSGAEVGSVSECGVSGWGDGMVDMKEGRDGGC